MLTQLGLHLTQQGMMTVLARCKPTDRRALSFVLFLALLMILMGVMDHNNTVYVFRSRLCKFELFNYTTNIQGSTVIECCSAYWVNLVICVW